MKVQVSRKNSKTASALLVTLFICTVLAVGLGAYLVTIEQQGFLSARSQSWNMAMAIVESGVEEGLEQYATSTNNLAANGWSGSGSKYSKTTQLDDGNSYTTTIDVTDPSNPVVTARATVNLPAFAANFYGATLVSGGPTTVSRAVQVTCSQSHQFNAAVIVKKDINLMGNGVYTDSFDSSDPTKSSNGVYCASIFTGDRGDVATDGGISSSVSIQNGNIYGKVHTGPGAAVTVGPNGAVGTHAWQAANSGFEPNYVLQDANFTFPDTTIPSGSFLPPLPGSVVTQSNNFTSSAVTTNQYPGSLPGGVQTNVVSITLSNAPQPPPAGLVTNSSTVTSSTLPSPAPAGTITNILTTSTTTTTYPSAGTYVGGVLTNYNGGGKKVTGYTYNLITGKSYTFKLYTYSYPTYTYTYDLSVTNITYFTNSYAYVLQPGKTYKTATLGSGTCFVQASYPPTNAVLILTGGLTGNENFSIDRNARLLIYADKSISLAGNQIVNKNGYAGSFIVYGTTNVTSFSLAGNGTFTGILVAPFADVALKGSGNNQQDFSGCIMANSLTLNGHFSFHYDEALLKDPNNGRFLVNSWNEINPNQ